MAQKEDSTGASWLAWGNGNRYRLIVVVAACGLGLAGVAFYAVEPDRPWVQVWFLDEVTHQEFLGAYRDVWPHDDSELEAA